MSAVSRDGPCADEDSRASADVIALLRCGLKPNEPDLPLQEVARPFWRVKEQGEAVAAKLLTKTALCIAGR